MSECTSSAPVSGAQSLIEKNCFECGSVVYGRTRHRQRCESCARAAKLGSYKRAAEAQRRKKGTRKVKGESFACEECGNKFVATSKSRAKYCPDCRAVVDLRRSNESSKKRGLSRERMDRFNEWWKQRGEGDPLVALSRVMRTLMHRELGRKTDRRGSWYEVVGYGAKELRGHLERQFLPGMTWENRGVNGWHIDHIRPISSFKYETPNDQDFKDCWALTNLRPMWGTDNIKKKDKRLFLI